jgi:AmmeMemoRadiSam system protein B
MESIIRYPAHAGTFYPADKDELIKLIEWSFTHPLGPGKLPQPWGDRRESLGYIVPHAGYIYSGPIAAHSYYHLSQEKPPETIILVGPNHNGVGLGAAVFSGKAWRTPLGDVEVDKEVAELIVAYSDYFSFDNTAHYYEHSLEVQLPFLQYIFKERPLRIVPITVYYQRVAVARDLARSIAKIITENGVDLVVIGSTDFNHYEPHDITVEKDMKAIEAIKKRDEELLYRLLEEENITMCGPISAAALMVLSKIVGGKEPVLLKHATSGDITGEKDWVVGYAAIKFPV